MSKKGFFLLLCTVWLFQTADLKAQKIVQPKLTPSEWWTAPYMDVFKDADIIYALHPRVAYQILDVIVDRATKEQQPKWVYEAHRTKGLYLERQLAFQAALDNYNMASNAIKGNDRSRFANVQIDIAIMYRNLYRYVDARNVYLKLIDFSIEHKDTSNLQNAYCGLGVLFFTVNDYDNAIRYYDLALQKSREANNYINECVYLDNLSEAYSCRKKYDKAFQYITSACRIAETKKDTESLIPLYERYARLYADIGEIDKAFTKINTGIVLCKAGEFIRDLNNLTIAKAELYLKQKNIEAALTTFKTINEKQINVNSLTKVFHELGKIYEEKNDLSLAESYFIKSQQLAEKNQSLRYNEWNHRALYRIYRLKNQPKEALFNLESANTLRDSLFNYEQSGQVTELQFRYDLAQSERKLQEAELKVNENRMWMGSLMGVLIISFLVFGYYWQRKRNEVLIVKNEAIREQKEQLEAFNQEILIKNKAIVEQKRLLEESNAMMKQFNYAVAHDLKEPLRNIANFATLIHRKYIKEMPPAAASYFEFVMSGSTRMGHMLEGLLKYSMMSMNQVTDLETVNMRDIVTEVNENLRVKIEEQKAQIIYPEDMPNVKINRIHLTQLIQNLISNSLKFVEGNPIIEIGSRKENENVLLYVKDNGIGIHPESGKKLFNLFHRLHRDTSRFEGTGVGLALCKNIVEKYGGKIWFESAEGCGTTFFVNVHS
jgi:signal transduction histidine kinase